MDKLFQATLLDAIYWVKQSWASVPESVITNCFSICGFGGSSTYTVGGNDCEHIFEEDIEIKQIFLNYGSFDNYLAMGNYLIFR